MDRFSRSFLLLVLAFSASLSFFPAFFPAFCQDDAPAGESESDFVTLSSLFEGTENRGFAVVQAELDTIQFEGSPDNIEFRSNAITSWERILNLFCFGNALQSLQFPGNPTDPTCRKYLEKTLAAEPMNPVATCARDGMGAESCRKAYEEQRIEAGDYTPHRLSSGGSMSAEEQERLQKWLDPVARDKATQKLRDRIAKLESERSSLQTMSGSARDAAMAKARNELALSAMYAKLLRVHCSTPRVRLAVAKYHMPEKSAWESDGLPINAKAAKAAEFTHFRQLPGQCSQYIAEARQHNPKSSAATCYETGMYSPKCFIALHQARDRVEQLNDLAAGKPLTSRPRPIGRSQGAMSTF